MSSASDINEQFLNDLFDKFSKEQMRLLNDMKQGNTDEKDRDIQKQMSLQSLYLRIWEVVTRKITN